MLKTIAIGILTGILTMVVFWIFKVPWKWVKRRYQKSKNAAHNYEKHYREHHDKLKAYCVGMKTSLSLDDIYVEVKFLDQNIVSKYGLLEDAEGAFQGANERLVGSNSDERPDGMRVASDEQYLMVLGDPGVGKSTFLRKVGLEAVKGKDGNFQHECTPVFLQLKRFTENSIDIEALITHEFKVCGYPYPEQMTKTILESDKLLLLLDGLDEVPGENVNNVVDKIGDFVNQYRQSRFVISSRIAVNIDASAQFTTVKISDFDDRQVEKYINNWFASMPNPQQVDEWMKKPAGQCWETLNAPKYQAIKTLTRNPLLLTMLCDFYSKYQNFPKNRTTLYQQALDTFLEKWPAEKYINRDTPSRRYFDVLDQEHLLSEIAAKNFEENCFLVKENKLIDQIRGFSEKSSIKLSKSGARKILKAITVEQWFFTEGANGVYSFSHLTFQEYLTANYFVSTQSIQQLVAEHLHDERWREVFLFTAELLPEADDLLVAMEAKATKCVGTDRLKILFGWAIRITNTSDRRYDKIAKRIFAIRQYFSLWLLNETYKAVKNQVTQHLDPNQNLDQDHFLDLYVDRDLDSYLYRKYRKDYQDLYQRRKYYRYQELDSYLDFYLNLNLYIGHKLAWGLNQYLGYNLDKELDSEHYCYKELSRYFNYYQRINNYLDPYFHQDPYQYMDTNFYHLVSSQLGDWFENELKGRITLLKRIGQLKIFKRVNLQWMIGRFNAQRKFIKAVREGKVAEPPEESIHDTWLSVLGITDDMLAISWEETENYIQYLRAIQLILVCKEAARCVSPDVWNRIEDRFLTVDTEESED